MMEKKIQDLISKLKNHGISGALGYDNPDEKINVWYVIAQLEEILLTEKK